MEGINLFANEKWSTILNKSYDFQGAPHYALIDKKGNIVSNNPKRPSAGLSIDIRELLSKRK